MSDIFDKAQNIPESTGSWNTSNVTNTIIYKDGFEDECVDDDELYK